MTTPFISLTAAILYFGWLWHDRSAVEPSRRQLGKPADQGNQSNSKTSHCAACTAPDSLNGAVQLEKPRHSHPGGNRTVKAIQSNITTTDLSSFDRVVLHLRCLYHDHKYRWHLIGV